MGTSRVFGGGVGSDNTLYMGRVGYCLDVFENIDLNI